MNKTQKILGFVLLVTLFIAATYTLAKIVPNPMINVSWHDMCSVGWHG